MDDEINVNDNWSCSASSELQSQSSLTQRNNNNSSPSMLSSFLPHSHSEGTSTNYNNTSQMILYNRDQSSSPRNDGELMRNPESKFVLQAHIVSIYFEDLDLTLGLRLDNKWPNAKELLHLLIITIEIKPKTSSASSSNGGRDTFQIGNTNTRVHKKSKC